MVEAASDTGNAGLVIGMKVGLAAVDMEEVAIGSAGDTGTQVLEEGIVCVSRPRARSGMVRDGRPRCLSSQLSLER